jgi:hypothetical protein
MSAPLPPFVFGTADDFNDVRYCVPRTLMSLAAKGPALLGLESRVVAAVGLAHLAASIGRSFFLNDGCTRIPACFNLAVVSERLPTRDWTASLGRGWTDSATQLRAMPSPKLQELFRDCVRDAATKRTERNIDPQFDAYEKEIPLNVVDTLRRRTITSKVDPESVARAIVDSRDHCVLLVNGASDPMAEWSQLSPAKRQRLAELLVLSWQDKSPPVTNRGAEIPCTPHVLWLTSDDAVRRAMFDCKSPALCRATPVLLFRHDSIPKRLPEIHAEEFQAWAECLRYTSNYRSQQLTDNDLVLTGPQRVLVEEFFAQFASALAKMPEQMHPYLEWLPELLMRLIPAIVMAKSVDLLKQQNTEGAAKARQPSTAPENAPVTMMQEAVRLTRWLCQEHYRVVCSYMGATSTDSTRQATDSTDIAALEEVILTKLMDKGPQDPRELQRRFHDLRAKERDRAVARLKSTGQVFVNAEGRLEAAA